jgi:peroxiredoxin
MRARSAASLILLFALLSPSTPQEKKLPPADGRQAQLNSLIQEFLKAQKEARAALRDAKSDAERKAAEAKMPKEADYLPRIHQLVAGQDDAVAAEALAFAVFGLRTKDEKVFEALTARFVKTENIRRFVQMAMTGAPDTAIPILESVVESNPSKELKGLACFALGAIASEKDGDAAAKEAEKHFTRVGKEFADVKAGRQTIGEMAKASLFELRHLRVGMTAPPTESKNLKGETVRLSDFQGKVVVLDFWTTRYPPSREMVPQKRELAAKFKDRPFALVSVSVDPTRKDLDDFMAKEPMPWTHWWEGADAGIARQWNVRFFPANYVIDAKGVLRYKHVGGVELEKAVEKLVGETEK